jgi:hypothetical protein
MKASETISLFERYVMPTYGRQPLVFVRGANPKFAPTRSRGPAGGFAPYKEDCG